MGRKQPAPRAGLSRRAAIPSFALLASIACATPSMGPARAAEGQAPGSAQPIQPSGQTAAGPSADVGAQAAPRCDATCVRVNTERAVQACAPRIEAEAATDFDWILRPLPGIFQQAEQSSPQDAIVRYRGDSMRFQTPTRDWARVTYECGYDVEARKVVFVNIKPGRLDRPPMASQVSSVPIRPPQGPAIPTGPRTTAASPAASAPPGPQAATRKPVRSVAVGEPSPIEILQQRPQVR